MNIQTYKSALAHALGMVMPAVSPRSRGAAGCIRIEAADSDVFVCADNRELGMRDRLSVNKVETGTALIPAQTLLNAVNTASGSYEPPITLVAEPQNGRFAIRIIDGERVIELEGPRVPKPKLLASETEGSIVVLAKSALLAQALGYAGTWAAASCGDAEAAGVEIRLRYESSTLEVVATKGKRHAVCTVPMAITARCDRRLILAPKVASAIAASLGRISEPVAAFFLEKGRNRIGVKCGSWSAWAQYGEAALTASEPEVRQALAGVRIDGAELSEALEGFAKLSPAPDAHVRLCCDQESTRIELCVGSVRASQRLQRCELVAGPTDLSIGFGLGEFADALRFLDSPGITAELNPSGEDCVFVAADGTRRLSMPSLDECSPPRAIEAGPEAP